jgi:uronate dehydrogenase
MTAVKVLVTGAAGSIGTVVCSGLLDRGHDVVGVDLVAEP